MLYFSEIKGKTVFTEDGVKIGKLDDLIFLATENPLITKLVIISADKNKEELLVPIGCLVKIDYYIVLKKDFQNSELKENEIYVDKNLVDDQIIDLVGSKIIRVNDIAIQDKGPLVISGIDIGFLGILRWLNLDEFVIKIYRLFGIKIAPKFLSWGDVQPLEVTRGKVILKKKEDKLKNLRPEDLADYLERTNIANTKKILKILDKNLAKEVIENFNVNYQVSLFHNFSTEKIVQWLDLINDDDAVDILLTFSRKRREEILSLIDEKKKHSLSYLLNYAKTPIGNLLIMEYLTVSSSSTVREVVAKIKKETTDFYYLNDIYVINEENQLIGVFNLHEMIMQDLDTEVYKFMIHNVIVLYLTTPKEIAIKRFFKYRLHVLPVIDKNKKMLGVVALDHLSESIVKKI